MRFLEALKPFLKIIVIVIAVGIGGLIGHAIQPKADKVVIEKTVVNDKMDIGKTQKDTANIILDGFKDMGELVTYEYYYKEVDTKETQRDFKGINIPLTKAGYTIAYDGTIDAGINFSDISVKVDDVRKSIMVTIPDAEIINNNLDESSLEVYDEKHNIFNPNDIEDFNSSLITIKQAAKEKAIKNGLLKNAKKNAKMLVENFVNSIIVDKDYKIYYN